MLGRRLHIWSTHLSFLALVPKRGKPSVLWHFITSDKAIICALLKCLDRDEDSETTTIIVVVARMVVVVVVVVAGIIAVAT